MKCLPSSASSSAAVTGSVGTADSGAPLRSRGGTWNLPFVRRRARPLPTAALLAACVFLGGCSTMAHRPVVPESPPVQIPTPPPAIADGAIYQPARGARPLFEDMRPRMPGDVLTIVFNEQVSATKNAQSNANRKSETSFTPGTVPGGFGGPGVLNTGLRTLGKLGTDLKGDHAFQGGGGAQANNTFTGTITVTVTEVLTNGNLRVRGEKQIGINQGTEYIRFAGTVDPRLIGADDSVVSTRVADARIEYVGDGYINDAQHMGWLQRALLKISPF